MWMLQPCVACCGSGQVRIKPKCLTRELPSLPCSTVLQATPAFFLMNCLWEEIDLFQRLSPHQLTFPCTEEFVSVVAGPFVPFVFYLSNSFFPFWYLVFIIFQLIKNHLQLESIRIGLKDDLKYFNEHQFICLPLSGHAVQFSRERTPP